MWMIAAEVKSLDSMRVSARDSARAVRSSSESSARRPDARDSRHWLAAR